MLTKGLAWNIPKKNYLCWPDWPGKALCDVNWLKRVPGERQLFKDDPAGQFMGSLAYGAVGVLLNAALPAAKWQILSKRSYFTTWGDDGFGC